MPNWAQQKEKNNIHFYASLGAKIVFLILKIPKHDSNQSKVPKSCDLKKVQYIKLVVNIYDFETSR